MIVGIDLSNIHCGGGIMYISEVLEHVKPIDFGFNRVIAWGSAITLSVLCDRSWLEKIHVPLLDRKLSWRLCW